MSESPFVPYWVGVRKDRYENHDVIQAIESDVTPEKYPDYDYFIGPFTDKSAASERGRLEKNCTGTFTDPFCNNGGGR